MSSVARCAAGGVHGYVAGYRQLAHSRWDCRSNTTGALTCFALHPQRRTSEQARRALDLLLGREAHALGYKVARRVGAEAPRGMFTFFARRRVRKTGLAPEAMTRQETQV